MSDYKSCGRKIRFPTKKSVLEWLKMYGGGNSMGIYVCDGCFGWHMYTQKRKKVQL